MAQAEIQTLKSELKMVDLAIAELVREQCATPKFLRERRAQLLQQIDEMVKKGQ